MHLLKLNTLCQKFLDVLAEYSTAQTNYKERKKKLLKRQLEITGQQVNEEQLEEMIEENRAVFTKDYIVQVEKAREDLTDVKERCSELLKIETSLRELNDMLLSLSILISNQGDIVDSIERHVALASADVKDGNKKVERSVRKQRKIRKTKFLIIAVVILIVCVLIGILVLTS
ncbi:syntaxin-1A-like [Stegodyphus dumicola]|uniref:syntaxin-1A-like n=1 Tax=Stegodyphus dumicola TaxID=202533 RepID=UPI0015AE37D0|nr:syntaxin-1A-like [Stegodyphus dumicola]